jgi:hypothetical protein
VFVPFLNVLDSLNYLLNATLFFFVIYEFLIFEPKITLFPTLLDLLRKLGADRRHTSEPNAHGTVRRGNAQQGVHAGRPQHLFAPHRWKLPAAGRADNFFILPNLGIFSEKIFIIIIYNLCI